MKNIHNLIVDERASPSSISMGLLNKINMKKKTGEKLKKTFKNVISYLRSDSHMYSSLLSDKPSSPCFSSADTIRFRANKGGMVTKRAKKKNKFLYKLGDYLKSDCYMYAPLVGCSSSVQAALENNRALKIKRHSKRAGKRPCGKNSSPRSTLVRNTRAFQREEKCQINPVGRSSSPSGGLSKGFKTNTIWNGE